MRGRRVELDAVFVLHHRPWRDTSRMLDVFTREHGRLMLFARGVRGPRSRSASLLQPFVPLLASWTGSGETAQLTQVEAAPGGSVAGLPAGAQGGAPLQADRYYHFHPSLGFVATSDDAEAAYAGRSLLALAEDDLQEDAVLEDARRLMRTALDDALEGRELRTRSVARAVTRSAARAAASSVQVASAAVPAVGPPSGETST